MLPKTVEQKIPLRSSAGLFNNQLKEQYKLDLLRAIEANKKYPKQAKRRRQQGQVKVSFILHGDGNISNICIVKSSGSKILDRAAMTAISDIGRFKQIPKQIYRDTWELVVPVTYEIL